MNPRTAAIATAGPTAAGYQEDRRCRNCGGKGARVRLLGARAYRRGGLLLGRSASGAQIYLWTECGICRGSGVLGNPEAAALAWAARVRFRWPRACEPGYAVRGVVIRGRTRRECQSASGVLGE